MKLNNYKILITGADGFIGSLLTELLVDYGYEVRAFVCYNSFNSNGWLDTIKNLHKKVNNNLKNGSNLIFEDGSVERDNVEWMIKYNKVPINSIQNVLKYKVLNPMFPSISIIDKFSI